MCVCVCVHVRVCVYVCADVTAVLPAAPSIYENVDIKKGILLQLFGGTKKSFDETGRGKFRWGRWVEGVVCPPLPCTAHSLTVDLT